MFNDPSLGRFLEPLGRPLFLALGVRSIVLVLVVGAVGKVVRTGVLAASKGRSWATPDCCNCGTGCGVELCARSITFASTSSTASSSTSTQLSSAAFVCCWLSAVSETAFIRGPFLIPLSIRGLVPLLPLGRPRFRLVETRGGGSDSRIAGMTGCCPAVLPPNLGNISAIHPTKRLPDPFDSALCGNPSPGGGPPGMPPKKARALQIWSTTRTG